MFAELIRTAAERNASDLFLGVGETPRLKVQGDFIDLGGEVVARADMEAFWKECGADPASDHDHDSSYHSDNGERFRVNLHRQRDLLGAVLRRIKAELPEMGVLGLPEFLLHDWLMRPSGLVLVTGPTGSGKSTTLAASLSWLNTVRKAHVVTIEDPIEYLFTNGLCYFTQRAVGIDTDSFANGLRASLRQAPDVIFVGEIRDPETAMIALQAAETGHLVLATLHSSGVTDAVERITNIFPESERKAALSLLSTQLCGVICQKLVPDVSGGRVLALEHFANVGATREWIENVELSQLEEFIAKGDTAENRTFLAYLVHHCQQGRVDAAIAEQASSNPTEFRRALRGIS